MIYYMCWASVHLFYMHYLKPHSHPSEVGPVIPSLFQMKKLVLLSTSHFATLIPKTKIKHKKKTTDQYSLFMSPAFLCITWTIFRLQFWFIYGVFSIPLFIASLVFVLGVTLYLHHLLQSPGGMILPVWVNIENLPPFTLPHLKHKCLNYFFYIHFEPFQIGL